jgi:hypothetical protein
MQTEDERQVKAATSVAQAQFDHLRLVFSNIY